MPEWRMELLEGEHFLKHWPSIRQMMNLIPHTWPDITQDSVEHRALGGQLQVWGVGGEDAINMVLFSQITVYSSGRVLEIFWGAGTGNIHLMAGDVVDYTLDEFAKIQECHRIDIVGREGWERILKPRGFKRTAIVLSRPVIHRGMQ